MLRITFLRTVKNLAIASSLYLAGFLILQGLLGSIDDDFFVVALHLTSVLSLYIYWKLEPWGVAKYDCFGSALLIFSILFRLLSLFGVLFYGARFDEWPATFWVNDSLLSLYLQGEIITQFGILLIVVAWRLTVQNKLERFSFLHGSLVLNKRIFWYFYILAVITQFMLRIAGVSFGSFAQLFVTINSLGVASIYLIAVSGSLPKSKSQVMKAMYLALPLSIFSLGSAMKESIFFPFIPAVIIIWFVFSSVRARVMLFAIGVCVLSVSQIYVGYVRNTTWNSGSSYSTTELVSGAFANMDWKSLGDGVSSVFSRVDATQAHALSVAIAERDGFLPDEIFEPIPATFIPRVLWEDKPVLQPGLVHTMRIFGTDESLSSATAAGFITEQYLGGGVIGVILAPLLYGFMVGKLQIITLSFLPAAGTAMFNFHIFYTALRLDETHVVYAFTGIVIYFLVTVLLFKFLLLIPSGSRCK